MRLCEEHPEHPVAESTVRHWVRERKEALGLSSREVYVPQEYGWGEEAQVDWYEAWLELGGERTKVQLFSMRSMKSGAAFHRAYCRATQRENLEKHPFPSAKPEDKCCDRLQPTDSALMRPVRRLRARLEHLQARRQRSLRYDEGTVLVALGIAYVVLTTFK